MRTQSLFIPSNFDGPTISVGRVAGARVDAVSKGLTATPGDTVYVPFIVRNPSNYPEDFELRVVAPGAPQATVYADTNGDGRHQDGEPAVTQTAALDPPPLPGGLPEREGESLADIWPLILNSFLIICANSITMRRAIGRTALHE